MEHFARSPFWRAIAVAVAAALVYLGWAISGGRSILPVAQAGGVTFAPQLNGLFTTDETGSVLYVWQLAGPVVERYSFESGTVERKRLAPLEPPARPEKPK